MKRITSLPKFFSTSEVPRAARWLIGKDLVVSTPGGILSGRIVETEAYGGPLDRACHAFRKRTARNEVMFSEAGSVYVYFIYGMHFCLNIVTGPIDQAYAVLIRALEPLQGFDQPASMLHCSSRTRRHGPLSGPGKLCKAMKITRAKFNGQNILTSELIWLTEGLTRPRISTSRRIGISVSKNLAWRFTLSRSPFISR